MSEPVGPRMVASLVTRPGWHHQARRMVLRARAAGLDVEHEHDGGRWYRVHLFTITGPRRDLRRFRARWSRWASALRTGQTADHLRDRKRRHAEIFARTLTRPNPTTEETTDER